MSFVNREIFEIERELYFPNSLKNFRNWFFSVIIVNLEEAGTKCPPSTAHDAIERVQLVGLTQLQRGEGAFQPLL